MDEKDLRRLSRRDLLEILIELSKENEKLRERNNYLEAQLQDKLLKISDAGSLAEAVLQLNGVFEAAQKACYQYTYNVQQRCRQREEETESKCEQMLRKARHQAKQYEKENR